MFVELLIAEYETKIINQNNIMKTMFSAILKKNVKHLLLTAFLLISANIFAQQTITDWMKTAQQRIDTLRKGNFTIKAFDKNGIAISDSISIFLKKHEFVFGCANDFNQNNYSTNPAIPSNNDWIKANMLKYFNFNVTGNAFKWSGTQPNNATSYNYGPVDSVVNWAGRAGVNLKGHTLLWGAYNDSDYHSIPKWAMQLPTNQALYDACKTRVQSMAQRYQGKFKEYDVINEPLHATWLMTRLGSDSIYWKLFKWVREIDTITKLYINDYNVEYNWGDANKYKALIKKMITKGAHIDGIGVQAHFWFNTGVNLAELKQNMDTLATIGLPIRFTEFDLAKMSPDSQAMNTASVYRFAFSHPAFNGIISWGFWDAGVWREASGYFDVNKNPKIAADSIYNLTHNIWTTNISTILTDSVNFKGYYGQYDVKVKFGSSWKQFSIGCDKLHKDFVFVLKEQDGAVLSPQFDTAFLAGKNQIRVKFNKKMVNPTASIRAFRIFQDSPIKIDSISLRPEDSSVVAIYLASQVNNNLVTVSYFDGAMKSADGGVLEPFGPEKAGANYVSCTSAITSVNGKKIELKFNKQMLDPSSEQTNFKVFVNGVAAGLDSVRLENGNDSIVELALSAVVNGTKTLLVSYTAGSITSVDGYILGSFYNLPVSNIVPSLKIVSAKTSNDGRAVEARFNMPLNDPPAGLTAFTVFVNNSAVVLDSVLLKNGNDSVIVFVLPNLLNVTHTLLLSYIDSTVKSKDGFELVPFSNFPVKNLIPNLTIVSVNTSIDGNTVEARFNLPMNDPSAQKAKFSLVNSYSISIDSVHLMHGNDSIFVFYLSKPVIAGYVLHLTYLPGSLMSKNGQKLLTIWQISVSNNVVTSIIEENTISETIVFPNPARDYIQIRSNEPFSRIQFSNLIGQIVLEKKLKAENELIDISMLREGTYLLTLITSGGESRKMKLIKIKI